MRISIPLTLVPLSLSSLLGACHAQDTTTVPPRPQTLPAESRPALSDGPHLFHQKDGSITAKWVAAGKVQQRSFGKGKPVQLPQFAELLGQSLEIRKHETEPAVWPMPEKLFAISDVEGQYDHMLRFLRGNGVVDSDGRWAFGKGHVVCIGDMVDRGLQVTETLWLCYRLAREAKAAGGHLHFVLGNHECMMMGGDVRYMAVKYKLVARMFGIPPQGLAGADTEIGRWLRTRNSMLRIGTFMFVHAGVSAPVASRKVDYKRFNDAIRSVLGTPPTEIKRQFPLALTWGALGPFWYRGYFKEHSLTFGPPPSVEVMDKILHNLGAKTIVIGHTKVPRIAPMYGKRRVLPIDIPWTDVEKARGILVQGDKIEVVDLRGRRTPLPR